MKLSILICAMTTRNWQPLYQTIRKQCTRSEDAEVLIFCDGGVLTSGRKRNLLTESANGEYIAFVDDDDSVSHSYINGLVAGCKSGADVVTFDLQMTRNGIEPERQTFGLKHNDREHINGRRAMTANHLCAWRRDIALRCRWDEQLGYGDDQIWYKALIAGSNGLTETHIDEVLYYYDFRHDKTANQQSDRVKFAKARYKSGGWVYVSDEGRITVQRWPIMGMQHAGKIEIR